MISGSCLVPQEVLCSSLISVSVNYCLKLEERLHGGWNLTEFIAISPGPRKGPGTDRGLISSEEFRQFRVWGGCHHTPCSWFAEAEKTAVTGTFSKLLRPWTTRIQKGSALECIGFLSSINLQLHPKDSTLRGRPRVWQLQPWRS